MGGIDCRYLTTHLTRRKFSVLSITTIATPHRGSTFANHFLATLGKGRMDSFLSLLDLLPNGGGDGKAFECLTIESMRKFNEEVPDVPGVKYFSWGSVYEPGFVDTWKWPHSVVLEKEGPNDGLVSVESAKWVSSILLDPVSIPYSFLYRESIWVPFKMLIILILSAGLILLGSSGLK